jgi:hypothetical protein
MGLPLPAMSLLYSPKPSSWACLQGCLFYDWMSFSTSHFEKNVKPIEKLKEQWKSTDIVSPAIVIVNIFKHLLPICAHL